MNPAAAACADTGGIAGGIDAGGRATGGWLVGSAVVRGGVAAVGDDCTLPVPLGVVTAVAARPPCAEHAVRLAARKHAAATAEIDLLRARMPTILPDGQHPHRVKRR